MSRNKDLRDLAILMALSGSEDTSNAGIQIESDYFAREREENKREQGFPVDMELPVNSVRESSIWRAEKDMEQANTDRWLQGQELKNSHLEKDYDEDRMAIVPSKRIVKI